MAKSRDISNLNNALADLYTDFPKKINEFLLNVQKSLRKDMDEVLTDQKGPHDLINATYALDEKQDIPALETYANDLLNFIDLHYKLGLSFKEKLALKIDLQFLIKEIVKNFKNEYHDIPIYKLTNQIETEQFNKEEKNRLDTIAKLLQKDCNAMFSNALKRSILYGLFPDNCVEIKFINNGTVELDFKDEKTCELAETEFKKALHTRKVSFSDEKTPDLKEQEIKRHANTKSPLVKSPNIHHKRFFSTAIPQPAEKSPTHKKSGSAPTESKTSPHGNKASTNKSPVASSHSPSRALTEDVVVPPSPLNLPSPLLSSKKKQSLPRTYTLTLKVEALDSILGSGLKLGQMQKSLSTSIAKHLESKNTKNKP